MKEWQVMMDFAEDMIYVQKFKRRKNYRRRRGYRASIFQVKIAELPGS